MATKTLIDPSLSSDYLSARTRFRAAAEAQGLRLESHAMGIEGPRGEDLTIDFAVQGAKEPERAVVLSSGTHGVEGIYGSAVQCALLEGAMRDHQPPTGTSVVFIHAVNPYGFAYVRRTNEDNVDLNRNMVKGGKSYEGSPEGYRQLDPVLNPVGPPQPVDPWLLGAGVELAKSGFDFNALKNVVAQGQHDFPRGLFFGGHGPSKTQRILEQVLPGLVGSCQRVVHLDYHTGMGKWGTYVLGVDLADDSDRVRRLRREFGDRAVQGLDPSGVLYEINGSLGGWLQDRFPDMEYDCLLAEYGTKNVLEVLAALRLENRAHHYCEHGSAGHLRAKRKLMEAFCPESRDWQRKAVRDGVEMARQALATLGPG